MESADNAWLFKAAGERTKMIVPTYGDTPPVQRHDPAQPAPFQSANDAPRNGGGNGGGGQTPPSPKSLRQSTLIIGAFEQLPDEHMEADDIQQWLELMEQVLHAVYKVPRQRPGSTNGLHER
jgi:hypothetical protein